MSPPSCCSISTFAAARDTRNEPLAITLCCRSQSATVVSSSDFDSDRPALLTTRSRPPNASTVASTAACTASSSVTFAAIPMATSLDAELGGSRGRLVGVEVGDHHARPLGGEAGGDGLADAGGGAGDQGDPAGQRLRLRQPGQLGLLQRPVLDPELLRLVDRRVRGHAFRAAHHVDRVQVELPGHPGGLLVLAVREHPHPGDQDDRRVRAADGRRVRVGVAVVVALVVHPVRLVQLLQPGDRVLHAGVGGQVQHQRLHLGPQEVVRARGAQTRQPRVLGRRPGTPAPVRRRCSDRPSAHPPTRSTATSPRGRRPWRAAPSRATRRSRPGPGRTAPPWSARRCRRRRCR